MTKKIFALLLGAFLIALLAGCDNPTSPQPQPHKLADDVTMIIGGQE